MSTPSFPLSSAQRRLWFLDQLSPGVPHYNIPLVFDIEGPLNPEVLQRALEELTRRHEPLRTVFHAQNGEPFQQVLPHQPFDLRSEDWSQLAPDDRAARLEPFLEHEVRQPFDLMRGPVFREIG